MTQRLLTPSIIAREGMMQLENNLTMAKIVHTDFVKEFHKVGDTISVRRPVKFAVTDGATLQVQDVYEGKFSVVVDQRKHVAWRFSMQDLTLSIEDYSERYIQPAMIALANQVDYDLQGLYKYVWNWRGTPGSTIDSFNDFAKGPLALDLGAVPLKGRAATLFPADHWGLLGSQAAVYNERMVQSAYENAELRDIGGINTMMSQNVRQHTVGTAVNANGTGLVSATGQAVTYASVADTNYQTLTCTGLTANATIKAGDVFTIAGVYAVNPINKQSTGVLQQFTVWTGLTITDATTVATLTISPAIITSGAYQTVDSSPALNATMTWSGGTASASYPQNMVFHKNAFALVTVPLELPDSVKWKARMNHKGLSIRVYKDNDVITDEEVIRLDILYGVKALYPDLATRLSGT